jgi:hypothetical protein
MRAAICCFAVAVLVGEVFGGPIVEAPISPGDVLQICRVIRWVTTKEVLTIDPVDEDHNVPGAVITGKSFTIDPTTGERTNLYTRTDLVEVMMAYKDIEHVEIYTVRKVRHTWRIESKYEGRLGI